MSGDLYSTITPSLLSLCRTTQQAQLDVLSPLTLPSVPTGIDASNAAAQLLSQFREEESLL